MISTHIYLNFQGNTEEAFNFYRSVFGGEFLSVIRFRDFPGNSMGVAEQELDKIAHIVLPLGPHVSLMATDSVVSWSRPFVRGNNFYINLETESIQETNTLFAALSEGGSVEMTPQETEWAECYAICSDKFGTQWMLNYTGAKRFG
ncbi:VOC family protein [Saccharophagus sp. K07]|uniref:VOC family protein n=1 Tax=Saccharophagus sp. K07 TaxID=2283636 RepID=UPI00165239E3|nr:VOC family protein [Saccharophagus sp. K07]MBC6905207.1 VOC family protein [Saccharophagus sp. K07]